MAKAHTTEEIIKEIESDGKYKIKRPFIYKNSRQTLTIIEVSTGKERNMKYYEWLRGKRPGEAIHKQTKKITTEFIKEYFNKNVKDYTIVEPVDITSAYTKFKIKYIDGTIYETSWQLIGELRSLPHKKNKIDPEYVKNEINKSNFYEVVEPFVYKNAKTPIAVKLKESNQIFYICWDKWRTGHRPERSVVSGPEEKIFNYLTENKIEFEYQKKFDTCKNIYCLPFDFYIPSLNLLIEYDGIQHYYPMKGLEELKKYQLRDSIKNKWAKDNNYILLRIKYTEDLDKVLSNIKNMYYCRNKIA